MACSHKGKRIYGISFEFFSSNATSLDGEVAWAIFVDEKFQKFVRWPAGKMKDVPYEGVKRSVPVPIRIGDFYRLIDAFESKPITVADLERDRKDRGEPVRPFDPGLTIVFLLVRAVFGPIPNEKVFVLNSSLRDQFNASRLNIGMTEAQVNATFHDEPIYSGNSEAGRFAIYGSHRSLDIIPPLHYSNVLVLYKDGKLTGIYAGESIPGGDANLSSVRALFSDLPKELSGRAEITK
jgi:hypothetical protein